MVKRRIEEARTELDKLIELKLDFSREWYESVLIDVDPSLTDTYFEGLRKAGLDAPK